jgi:hypothetical protein
MSRARQERQGLPSGMSKNGRKLRAITESAQRSQKRHCNFRRQLTVFVSGSRPRPDAGRGVTHEEGYSPMNTKGAQ